MRNVIIIGAGPAGITAGYELIKLSKDYNVTILEESNYIGGLSRTEDYKGNKIDIGGHRFFSKNSDVNKWWKEILSNSDSINSKEMLKVKRVSSILYKGDFYDYPVKLNKNTIKNLGISTMVKVALSYFIAIIHKRQEKSLEDFYINRFGKKLYTIFFKDYTQKVWGINPNLISSDWGVQRVKGLSIKEIIRNIFSKTTKETSLIDKFYYPRLGPGQLWNKAANIFVSKGGIIKKGCKVVNLYEKNHEIKKISYIENGVKKELEGDIVISSMPLKDMIAGLNNVPEKICDVAKGLQYRDFVTVGLLVNKKNIKLQKNNIIDCWIYIQDKSLKLGRIQIYNNWSSCLVKNPENYMWFGLEYYGKENDKYWNLGNEQWLILASSELTKLNIISSESHVEDFCVIKQKKAYPSYVGTYDKLGHIIAHLDKYSNLYCIGRNGQHHYNNMDHSMVTAFETVKNIKYNKETKENIWNVNTEKEYHESIKEKSRG